MHKLAIVLKDNAYGHGLLPMATLANQAGVAHAVVRTLDEAHAIASLFQTVLVLAQIPSQSVAWHIHITVNSLEDIARLTSNTSVELKVDTGMHRNGIRAHELEAALEAIKERGLVLKGVFTHFKAADTLSSDFFWQTKQFETVKTAVKAWATQHKIPLPRFHSANSAGLFRMHALDEEIARVGIAAYGLLELPFPFTQPNLKPVLSLWGERLASFAVKKGYRLGYDGVGVAQEDTTFSTYDIGYADGLLRLDDQTTYTNEEGVSIIGRVSMDNIIANTTTQELCLFSDARAYAKKAGTISYEVVVRLAPHLKRTVS